MSDEYLEQREANIRRMASYRDGHDAGLCEGYRRGQEAMRERAARVCGYDAAAGNIRALPIEELLE